MQHALILDRVTKRFGTFTAVDELSLQVPKGCIYGFLGQNGAGKTTTIRMVMSIFHPDSGSLSVLGEPDAQRVKDRLGYLPEEKGLYKKMKTAELVAYFGKLKGMASSTANLRARELLTRYGLGDWLDKRCEAMSKGMGQKVQILGTIIHDPELVILDEPFSGLDPVNQQALEAMIRGLAERGATVVFSTHVMQHAERLCDQVVLLARGRKAFDGTVAEAKAKAPRALILEGALSAEDAAALPGVGQVTSEALETGGSRRTCALGSGAAGQEALKTAFARGLDIQRFELREPTLHDAFIVLTGQDPGPADQPEEAA